MSHHGVSESLSDPCAYSIRSNLRRDMYMDSLKYKDLSSAITAVYGLVWTPESIDGSINALQSKRVTAASAFHHVRVSNIVGISSA